jgi:hypothetical protein
MGLEHAAGKMCILVSYCYGCCNLMNFKQINVGAIPRVIKLPCAYLLGKYLRWQKLRTPIQHFYSGVCEYMNTSHYTKVHSYSLQH